MKKMTVEFTVEGFPPAYDSGLSIRNPVHPRYPLVQKLQKAAENAMRRKVLLKGDVILEVEQETSGDRGADVANLIGGIANSLEGISYFNDDQIKEVHYRQIPSHRDVYKVTIKKME